MTPIANMNPVDLGILAVLLAGFLVGLWEGISKQVLRLVSYVVSVYATIFLQVPVGDFLERNIREVTPAIPRILAAVTTFLTVYLTTFLLGKLVLKVFQARNLKDAVGKVGLGPLDRLLGGAVCMCGVGLVLGGFFLGVAVYGNERDEEKLRGSTIRPVLMNAMEKVLIAIPAQQKADLQQALERLKNQALETTGELVGEGSKGLKTKIDQINGFLKDVKQNAPFDLKLETRQPNTAFPELAPAPVPEN